MSEPIIDEGLWDRVRDNEQHYSRLLDIDKQHFARQFETVLSSPELPYSSFAHSFFDPDVDWSKFQTGESIEVSNADLNRILSGGISAGSLGMIGGCKTLPRANVFFDFESPIDWDRRIGELHRSIGLACPHARGPEGVQGVDGIPSVSHEVIVMPRVNLPNWSKEILKFQSGDVEVTEVQGPAISQAEHDLHLHMIGSMFQTLAPEIRDAAKLIGNEEAIDVVLDSLGGSPYMENLDELTPEQIAIHNPPVKPMYRIPPRPEPKPRCEVSKRKSVAKAARKRAQAGRKKNRG